MLAAYVCDGMSWHIRVLTLLTQHAEELWEGRVPSGHNKYSYFFLVLFLSPAWFIPSVFMKRTGCSSKQGAISACRCAKEAQGAPRTEESKDRGMEARRWACESEICPDVV